MTKQGRDLPEWDIVVVDMAPLYCITVLSAEDNTRMRKKREEVSEQVLGPGAESDGDNLGSQRVLKMLTYEYGVRRPNIPMPTFVIKQTGEVRRSVRQANKIMTKPSQFQQSPSVI